DLDRLPGQQQGAAPLALLVAELGAQEQAVGVVGVDVEGLLQGLLGLLDLAVAEQEPGLLAPGLGVAAVGADHLVHGPQGRLVLAVGLLVEGPLDAGVDRLTAPLELLAAAARAGGVGVEGHGDPSRGAGSGGPVSGAKGVWRHVSNVPGRYGTL